jgi:Tol biopolymer transport system component
MINVAVARVGLIAWLGIILFPIAVSAAPVKLNGSLVVGGDVDPSFRFSTDGGRVLYAADQTTDEVFELYSVSSAGGSTLKLNGAMVNGGDVIPASVRISPDGSRVAYVADQEALSQHCAARDRF